MKNTFLLVLFISVLISCKDIPKNEKAYVELGVKTRTDHNIKLNSGSIQRIDSFPSKFVTPRPVDIWLPEGYSDTKKYAVLYMHDGQMLFDATTTWNKQEWKVDEHAGKLQKEGKTKDFIVVAIHNISKIRWNDYFPAKTFNYLSQFEQGTLKSMSKQNKFDMSMNADEYLHFITQEVKPYIDASFSVYTDRENTFIAGSSMGGLISMYAICEYPDVFGAAACISTHWPGIMQYDNNPVPEAIFAYMRSKVPTAGNHRFYFDYGTETLDQHYPQYAATVNQLFEDSGYDNTNFVNRKFEDADHSENSWNKRLDIPLTFLLKK